MVTVCWWQDAVEGVTVLVTELVTDTVEVETAVIVADTVEIETDVIVADTVETETDVIVSALHGVEVGVVEMGGGLVVLLEDVLVDVLEMLVVEEHCPVNASIPY